MSEKSAELKAVCKELDQLLLEFMDKMEAYQAFYAKCIGHMKTVRTLYFVVLCTRTVFYSHRGTLDMEIRTVQAQTFLLHRSVSYRAC